MPATIYFRGDESFTPEQLELYSNYYYQTLVWTHSLLKATAVINKEDYDQKRKELAEAEEKLEAIKAIEPVDTEEVTRLEKQIEDFGKEIKEYRGPFVDNEAMSDLYQKHQYDALNFARDEKMPDIRDPRGGAERGWSIQERFAHDMLTRAVLTYNPEWIGFKGKTPSFTTYLWAIMVNQAKSDLNSWTKKQMERLDAPIAEEEGEASLEDALEALDVDESVIRDIMKRIEEYLVSLPAKLPAKQPDYGQRRFKILQMLLEGHSQREIAREVGLHEKRLHDILHGARGTGGRGLLDIIKNIPSVRELPGFTKYLAEQLKNKTSELEDLLKTISSLRDTDGIDYNLLRNVIQQNLTQVTPQLFTVYSHLYEEGLSNPGTARTMNLSPCRITGIKKKILATLVELPEIQGVLDEVNGSSSTSSLRRFLFREDDRVKVLSINKTGTIERVFRDSFKIKLDNDNVVITSRQDLQKHSTLVESTHTLLSHYFSSPVLTKQCYISLASSKDSIPALVIVELSPSSEQTVTARLFINDVLIDLTSITEEKPNNLLSVLKGRLGPSCELDPPFTSLFCENSND